MPNDYEIALLLQQQYDGVAGIFNVSAPYGLVSWALKRYDDCDVICFEGSHDVPDFERDFKAKMIHVDGLGGVHGGFYEGLPEVLTACLPLLSIEKLTKISGHSLGGGEAHIFTALLALAGFTKLETVTFGSPLPGDKQLSDLIAPFPNRSYWNYRDFFHHDIVGSVPVALPEEPYVFPRERILIDEPPEPLDPWLMAAWHHLSSLYLNGLKKLFPCAASSN